jgi:lysophospholipase L1-like esterase
MRMLSKCIVVSLLAAWAVATSAGALDIRVNADGTLDVTGAPPAAIVRYTLNGSEPARDAGAWLAPVRVPDGYTLKARAFAEDDSPIGDVVTWNGVATTSRTPSTLVPLTQNRDWRVYDWTKRHEAAVSLMKERQPEIVLIGDSITHFWGGDPVGGRRTGAEVWDRFFSGRRVVNLGYGWDRTENVLWRLTHGEFDNVTPRVVVVMIGTNNVTLNTPEEIGLGITAICHEIHRRSPSSRILLLGIFPRGERPDANRRTIDEINRRIAELDGHDGITYLDLGRHFLADDGSISKDVMYDFLHPSAKGYEIWADAMGPTLERLLAR